MKYGQVYLLVEDGTFWHVGEKTMDNRFLLRRGEIVVQVERYWFLSREGLVVPSVGTLSQSMMVQH